ncbi:MAG: N-acyl homoserine lactonase family protein [Pseudomonadales bacterium]|nr:N-acyl homoserine lactonase family protein [Pseudomonadales bacterium]NRA14835.1 N-acyl homoserine lactonase family protein [Oceanospirillaceae bacterium]
MKKLSKTMLKLSGLMLLSTVTAAEPVSIESLQTKSAAQIKLYVLDCGTVQARDLSVFNPKIDQGVQMDMAVPCYLIKHPSKGTLVWDAGLSDAIASEENGVEFYEGAFNLSVKKTMLSQLQEIGVEPAQVTYFAPSHLHVDHSGNANYFADSTVLMQQAEYQVAFSADAANYGFDINNYSALKDAKRIQLQGDHDVFGDGSAVILSTPGHSPGHQSLYLKLPETGPVILSGDLFHFEKNRQDYGIPVWNDKKSTISSFAKIDNILDQTSAKLWIQHDPEQAKSMRMSPAYYQ